MSHEHREAESIHNRSLFQCLTTLTVNKCFLMPTLRLPWHSVPFPSCHLFQGAQPSTSLFSSSAGNALLQKAVRLPLGLLQMRQLNCPQPLLIGHVFQPCCPSQDAFKNLNILLTLRGPVLHAIFKVRLHQC